MSETTEDLAMTIEQCIIWLTQHAVTWQLSVDPHESTYETMEEYLSHNDSTKAFLDELGNAEHLYEIQAYPNTPIAFQILWAGDLAEGLRRMCADIAEVQLELKKMNEPKVDPAGHNFDPIEVKQRGTENRITICVQCNEPKGSPAHPISENLLENSND